MPTLYLKNKIVYDHRRKAETAEEKIFQDRIDKIRKAKKHRRPIIGWDEGAKQAVVVIKKLKLLIHVSAFPKNFALPPLPLGLNVMFDADDIEFYCHMDAKRFLKPASAHKVKQVFLDPPKKP